MNGLPKKSQHAKKEETIRHMNEIKKQEGKLRKEGTKILETRSMKEKK
jgi:hypothetical protein